MKLDHLHCIDLDQPSRAGFRRFISSWYYAGDDLRFVVDPGPISTIPHLLAELRRLGAEHLDYILLTHIHIDHAGGSGALLEAFPSAQVICHPEGIRHLLAPEKLWQGSRQVLGDLAELYGPIVPVPEGRIAFAETLGGGAIQVFATPGHAQHHLCYLCGDLLFGGEVAGVRSEVADGIFMRPATPPRFALKVALGSIERMLALAPQRMVFAHYGLVEDAGAHLQIAQRQLHLWVRGVAATAAVAEDEREAALQDWLLAHDPIYANVTQLPDDIRARERYFFGNTVRGMSEYVAGLSPQERAALATDTSTHA
jgi:glyoxylase-like metal-dependent hydrolase (beta-lactamase superfamily II)